MFTSHHLHDVFLYFCFFLGQAIYIVKRAGFSMRAGRAPSRRAYVYQNWDILMFRSAFEFVLIFMPFTHFAPGQILAWFHIDISSFASLATLQTPVRHPVALFGVGIGSDGLADWFVDWASRSPKIPQGVRNWLTENVPPVNGKH